MFDWDHISWTATALFVVSLVLGALVSPFWLYLLVASYLLRPTLYSLGVARRCADERQLSVQFRSGNIAFTILILAVAGFAIRAQVQHQQVGDFVTLLIIGLAAKALMGLLLIGDFRAAGVRIAIAAGLAIALFTGLEGGSPLGMFMQSLPGLLLIAAGMIGHWKPAVGAMLLGACSVASFIFFGPATALTTSRVLMALVLSLPLAVAAWCFWRGAREMAAGAGAVAVPPDNA
jgi:hypothetical protein